MNRLLVFTPYYYPAYKAGGPIRSVYNLVYFLKNHLEFYIVTGDRDYGDNSPFKNIKINKWNTPKDDTNSNVYYSNWKNYNIINFFRIVKGIQPKIIYINSFFNIKFSLSPLLASKIFNPNIKIIIAPRGELYPGALKIRKFRKTLFILFFKIFRLDKKLIWHATTSKESKQLFNLFGNKSNIVIAKNYISAEFLDKNIRIKNSKQAGILKIIYLSRLTPKKNLLFCLNVLNKIKPNIKIIFDIYGVSDDSSYLKQIKNEILQLPDNIKVNIQGSISHENVLNTISKYDLFFLPTYGENFGHAILESLYSGVPVLISDKTPWRNLSQKGMGWDISLDNKSAYINKIEYLANLNKSNYLELKTNIKNNITSLLDIEEITNNYLKLFEINE